MKELIGLSGFARVGKDTVAEIMVEEFGFTQVAFADKLREAIYELNPIVAPTFDQYGEHSGYVYVQDVIDRHGWDGYKEKPYGSEVRRLLQRGGTEMGRGVLGKDIWVNSALTTAEQYDRVVFTDVRFISEAQAIIDRGGEVWRIERAGVGPLNDHASENEMTNFTGFSKVIRNDSTVTSLRQSLIEERFGG